MRGQLDACVHAQASRLPLRSLSALDLNAGSRQPSRRISMMQ